MWSSLLSVQNQGKGDHGSVAPPPTGADPGGMSPPGKPDWATVRALFEAALEREGSDRAAFLDEACGGDERLRREVEALLAASDDEAFLATPVRDEGLEALRTEAEGVPPEARVGPYQLGRLLGRGGMGRVYAADRDDGAYAQQVAVKLLRSRFPTEDLLRRFAREREILASLDHPGIARILDGGSSQVGPWLAMEFVDGQTLPEHVGSRELTLAERIHLFVSVCDAVDHAHRRGVVHRDLKPSNVLVTDEGRVKLLDFGIATLLGADGGVDLTQTGTRPHTPEYASPEQVRGEPATTASDIWSLGALLYELLTGRRPYDLAGLTPGEREHRLTSPPQRPSEVSGRRELRGDLDAVVLKALHPDPERRYASAAGVAQDLKRHLAHRPVAARPDGALYRLRSWARRNPVVSAAAALLIITATIGAGATVQQARRAEAGLASARDLARSLLIDLDRALEDLPESTPVRALLVSQALESLERLSNDVDADPELLLLAADAYDRIGTIQGNPLHTNLGDLAAARDSHERALAIREGLGRRTGSDPFVEQALGTSYFNMAVVTRTEGDVAASTAWAERAVATLEPLHASDVADARLVRALEGARTVLGANHIRRGEFDRGLEALATAVAGLERVAPPEAADVDLGLALWEAYGHQVDGWRFSSRYQPALDVLEDTACPMLERLATTFPRRASVLWGLQSCWDYLGTLQEKLYLDDPEDTFLRALGRAEELVALDPANERANAAVTTVLVSLGRRAFMEGRVADGERYLGRAVGIRRELQADNPSNTLWTSRLASVLREYCRGLVNNDQPGPALPWCIEAVDTHVQHVTRQRDNAIAQVTLAYALGHTARAYRALAETAAPTEAARLRATAVEFYLRSVAAYERAGSFGDNADYEIHPDAILAELALLERSPA